MNFVSRGWRWVTTAVIAGASLAQACGPNFPNMMLVGGDRPVFTAPVARFYDEVERISRRLNIPQAPAPEEESDNNTNKTNIELGELRAALQRRGDTTNEVENIVAGYESARSNVLHYALELKTWRESQSQWWRNFSKTNDTPPEFPATELPARLPDEFADYFAGASAWHRGDTNAAREAWERLLERPLDERRYRSTWAAFMLAKSYEIEAPGKAITLYSQVRTLAAEGFHDALGLANDSRGWQARAHLHAGQYDRAIQMYLDELGRGDGTAYQSLRICARRALDANQPTLEALARSPRSRAIITAHVISTDWDQVASEEATNRVQRWLGAMERANVTDADSAERLALAYYQAGQYDLAQRWVKRAPASPVAQWINAKLLLYRGKVTEAAAIISRLSREFPLVEPTNNPHATLADNLYVPDGAQSNVNIGTWVRGELGVLKLHRRDYVQSLDTLLTAGFFVDASYVAERVLTLDELKAYVDRNWPEMKEPAEDEEQLRQSLRPSVQTEHIRYLLARRMMRSDRAIEARAYYPAKWRAPYDQLLVWLVSAGDEAASSAERGSNYYRAAWMVRTNGMELMGTEVGPDYTAWGGDYEAGPDAEERAREATNSIAGASADELKRAAEHEVDPATRFHYRGHAAALALKAALMFPDNSDAKARMLYSAGRWVQDLDTADRIYKMLVRKCRKTELGKAADEWRWFPRLDENDKPRPKPLPKPVNEE